MVVDPADEAVRVARGFKVDRGHARHDEGAVVVRLVVVAVEEDEVARGEEGVQHDLVRGARAVQNKVRLVGVVDLGGRLLRGAGGAFVNEEVAHRDVGVARSARKTFSPKNSANSRPAG